MKCAERILYLEEQLRNHPERDTQLPPHAMTLAQQLAYAKKEAREQGERRSVRTREREALMWMESNFTSLAHYRRYVEGLEQIMLRFCREEQRGPHWGVSSCMRELVEEDPVLFADLWALMQRDAAQGWGGIDPLPEPQWRRWLRQCWSCVARRVRRG